MASPERQRGETNVSQELEAPPPQVLHPKDERRVRLMRPLFEGVRSLAFLNPGTNVYGGENLKVTQELLFQGKKLILTPNHLSHVDHFFLWAFIDQECRQWRVGDLWEQFVFVGRESLYGEAHFRKILRLGDIIGVVSSRELEKLIQQRDRVKITKADRINKQAQIEMEQALSRGKMLVVYPEGQRSINSTLRDINRHVAPVFRMADYIVPVGFYGTEYVLPYEWQEKFDKHFAAIVETLTKEKNKLKVLPQLPKLMGRLFKDLPQPFAPVAFNIGQPYLVPQEASDKDLVRMVGAKIAELLPPEYRGSY